jgi:hypothetical protein
MSSPILKIQTVAVTLGMMGMMGRFIRNLKDTQDLCTQRMPVRELSLAEFPPSDGSLSKLMVANLTSRIAAIEQS